MSAVMRQFTRLLLILFASVLAVSAKLKEAAMRLPSELSGVERLAVSGRQGWKDIERLAFGGYLVTNVDRSFTKGSSLQILVYEGAKARQNFSFYANGDGLETWKGEAESTAHRRALDFDVEVELRNKAGFAARLSPLDRPGEVWTLQLAEKWQRPFEGTLGRGQHTVKVRGTNKLAGTILPLGETSGYVFEYAGQPVAAVEVINDGAAWFSPDLQPDLRAPVASAISALLLFEELRKTFPD
jgi:hypothetical protein